MAIIRMTDIEGRINKRGILSKLLVNQEHLSIHNLVVKASQTIPPHAMPVAVTFFVVSGTGVIRVGGEDNHVQPGDIVQCPIETKMSVSASADEDLSILNLKTPSLKT